jgi:hypothetical protein
VVADNTPRSLNPVTASGDAIRRDSSQRPVEHQDSISATPSASQDRLQHMKPWSTAAANCAADNDFEWSNLQHTKAISST